MMNKWILCIENCTSVWADESPKHAVQLSSTVPWWVCESVHHEMQRGLFLFTQIESAKIVGHNISRVVTFKNEPTIFSGSLTMGIRWRLLGSLPWVNNYGSHRCPNKLLLTSYANESCACSINVTTSVKKENNCEQLSVGIVCGFTHVHTLYTKD